MPAFPAEPEFPRAAFADVLAANERFASDFELGDLDGRAARGLAVVTCIDSRIDPLATLGMAAGDVKIVRNAGARVSDDVLRTLTLAAFLLGVSRVLIMPHTDCRMARGSADQIHQQIYDRFGVDTRSVEFHTVDDQLAALRADLIRVRAYPLLPPDVVVAGAIYDVHSGRLEPITG